MAPIKFSYKFTFPNGTEKNFQLELDEKSLNLVSCDHTPPDWAILTSNQCQCCTLDIDTTSHCPIAANLAELVIAFKDTVSYESCHVTCTTAERTISKQTIVQDGLSSIMGIIMATSGCPIMDILKPLARFHLPFATVEESLFRSISVYLLGQFFKHLDNDISDFHLEKVKSYYGKIEIVNAGILSRVKQATIMDADKNAIIILNCLAQILYLELDDDLQSLRHIFKR